MIIDAHLHLWNPERLNYEWLQHVPSLNTRIGPEDCVAARLECDGAVFVQADCDPTQALDEVDWVNSLNFPIIGIVGYVPLELGNTHHIADLKVKPNVVGVRRNVQNETEGFIKSDKYIDGMIAAPRADLSIDMCVRTHQLPELTEALTILFQAEPEARVILDHLGKPDIAAHGSDICAGDWAKNITALSALPNLVCKLSGLLTQAKWNDGSPEKFLPYLEHALEVFGSRRCLFGGDWPLVQLAGGHHRWRDLVSFVIAKRSATDQAQIWSDTAKRIYRIN